MTDLYSEHLTNTENGLKHERFRHLQARALKPEYTTHKIVASETRDRAYLVSEVETLTVPFEEADVVEDRIQDLILCGCDDYFYRCSAGLEVDLSPVDVEHCKHCAAYKELRAKADKDQTELTNNG